MSHVIPSWLRIAATVVLASGPLKSCRQIQEGRSVDLFGFSHLPPAKVGTQEVS